LSAAKNLNPTIPMPKESLTFHQAVALGKISRAFCELDELLPRLDVVELPEPHRLGLCTSLERIHAHIHQIKQTADLIAQ
jgi:hypothetical protein